MPAVGASGELAAIEERVRLYLIEKAKGATSDPFQAKVTYSHLCSTIDPEQHYWVPPRYRENRPGPGPN